MKCSSEQFFSIDPDILVDTRAPTFDVFVYMALSERIVLFCLSGDVLPREKIDRMKAKGLKSFHVRAEHRAAYQQYLALVEADRLEALRAEHQKKLDAAKAAGTGEEKPKAPEHIKEPEAPEAQPEIKPTAEDMKREFEAEVKPEDVMKGLLSEDEEDKEKAKEESKKMMNKILAGPPKMDATTKQIIENPDTEHATNVAIYSVLFAMGLGQKNQMFLQDLIIASLLHDIGVTQAPLELLAIPTTKRTTAQNKNYEAHVPAALTLLEELDYTPNPRIVAMLTQHHEKFNGTGYPNHMESFRIDEFAQIIAFADLLDTICLGRHDEVERSMSDALKEMSEIEKHSTFPQYFNPDLFRKIMRWLKNSSGSDFMKQAVSAVEQTKEKLSKAG